MVHPSPGKKEAPEHCNFSLHDEAGQSLEWNEEPGEEAQSHKARALQA